VVHLNVIKDSQKNSERRVVTRATSRETGADFECGSAEKRVSLPATGSSPFVNHKFARLGHAPEITILQFGGITEYCKDQVNSKRGTVMARTFAAGSLLSDKGKEVGEVGRSGDQRSDNPGNPEERENYHASRRRAA